MEPCNSTRSKWSLVQGFLYTKQEGNMKVRYGDADVDDHILENMVITSVFFRSILAPLTVFFLPSFSKKKMLDMMKVVGFQVQLKLESIFQNKIQSVLRSPSCPSWIFDCI